MTPSKQAREPLWLSAAAVRAMHADQIRDHGGMETATDEGKLESALARAPNRHAYATTPPSIAELAAEYAFGTGGNKRVAFMSAYAFMRINGVRLTATEVDAVATIQALAAGELDVAELAVWFATNSAKAKRSR